MITCEQDTEFRYQEKPRCNEIGMLFSYLLTYLSKLIKLCKKSYLSEFRSCPLFHVFSRF